MDALKQVHQKMLQVTYVRYLIKFHSIHQYLNKFTDMEVSCTDLNTLTKPTITQPTFASLSTTSDALSLKKYTSSPQQPPQPKLKLRSLLLHLPSHSQRLSVTPSRAPVWLPASFSSNKMEITARTLSQLPSRSMLSPVSGLERPDLPRTLRFRAVSWLVGAQPSTQT